MCKSRYTSRCAIIEVFIMVVNNGKNRTPKIGQGDDIRNAESRPERMGIFPIVSQRHGTYEVSVSGNDSNEADTVISRGERYKGISGKLIGQLIEETQKQLAYHRTQTEVLEERLCELKEAFEAVAPVKNK
jgi:hypothetical protein